MSKIHENSSIEKMEMAESTSNPTVSSSNDSYLVKKKYAFIILVVVCLLFAGSILATYFGKQDNSAKCLDQLAATTALPFQISTTISTDPPYKPVIDYRLPDNLKPYLYDLYIKPYIGLNHGIRSFTFEGNMKMFITCIETTNKIVFHVQELNIDEANVKLTDLSTGNSLSLKKPFEFDQERLFVVIHLNDFLKKSNNYSLEVPFNGNISSNLYGFYKGSYTEAGTTYYLASTDFEPVDARRCFPCFDEPAMKAKFKLTMNRENDLNTISNSPLKNSISDPKNPGWSIDYFDETVPMSTYLMAFVVSNFEKKSRKSPIYDIDIEVAARPEAIRNGDADHALDEAAKIIDFFSTYFNTPYPLPKSTQVAVPNFNSGAMENWGIVIYREASLLYNNKTDTISNKRRVSQVVSHELAHQWFGNLVTMAWWNDLWLNEGFASWVEYLGYNSTNPDWKDLDYFFVSTIPVLVKDSFETSHPISVTVNDPKEIGSLFDSISYDKGASIIRMMNAFLTEKTFKAGVSNYLNNHKYANAAQDDLWAALTNQSHLDGTLDKSLTVKQIMDTWTLRKGYPVVKVTRDLYQNKLKVTQTWFLLNPESNVFKNKTEYNSYKWYVPFTFTTKNQLAFNFETTANWLKPTDSELNVNVPDNSSWIIANIKHAGFYRVNYDTNNWNELIKQLNNDHQVINNINRAELLDDSFNLGRADLIDQTIFLNVSSYLMNEQNPLPFRAAFYGLDFISDIISSNQTAYDMFKDFYIKLIEKQYTKLGWNLTLDDVNEIDLQLSVLKTMCKFGNSDCIQQSRKFYSAWINENQAIPSNFKSVIYQTVIAFGDREQWYQLYNIALKETNEAEKLRILRALTFSKDYELLKFLLGKTRDDTVIKKQDETTIVTDIATNPIGRRLAIDYLDYQWDYFLERYGSVSFTLPNLVSRVLGKVNTAFGLEKVKQFKQDHPVLGVALPSYNEAVETVSTNVNWLEKNLNPISKWLTEYLYSAKYLEYRLPSNLMPSNYQIFIQPFFKKDTKPEYFLGSVKINFNCLLATNKLVIHKDESIELKMTTFNITSSTDSTIFTYNNDSISYVHETDLLTIEFNQAFKQNNQYSLFVEYKGKYFSDNLGFYRNDYKNDSNVTNWLVSSQFEPVKARRAFPCFDEPAMKATFEIQVKHDDSMRAISNMPVISSQSVGSDGFYNWIETKFNKTLKMSTYIVALIIADYNCIENSLMSPLTGNQINSSSCARPNAINQLDLAANASVELLGFFEKYYNISYPFPKLDHFATPDFAYGAMENWGLAIYREPNFLFAPNISSQAVEQNVVRIISHEISHMWFGNLVTPKWWDDLWLNEGFARYMEYLGTSNVRSDWGMIDQYMNLIFGVFHADSEEVIRPLSPGIVNSPEEIDAMVDGTITYGKGSAVVRMLNYILGENTFVNALTSYFNKFSYQNVDQFDLWTALNNQAILENKIIPVNLSEAMRRWTKQRGHPLVTVIILNSTHISLTQKRFVLNSTTKYEALKDFEWYIPFSYSIDTIGTPNQQSNNANSSNIYNKIEWLNPKDNEKIVQLNKPINTVTDYFIANLDAAGYFRVNYEKSNWLNIIQQLNSNKNEISIKMRAQLINDAFGLSQATEVPADLALKLVGYLCNETDYLPWNVFLSRSKFYTDMLDHTKYGDNIQKYFAKLTNLYYSKFNTWHGNDTSNETWLDRQIKTNFIQFACFRGQSDCVRQAKDYFSQAKKSNDLTKIPALFRPTVYCIGIREGTNEDFDFLFNQYNTLGKSNKTEIFYGLSCSKDLSQLSRCLSEATNPNNDINFTLQAIRNVSVRPNGNSLSWSYIKSNWDSLYEKSSVSGLTSLITDITNKFNNQDQYDDFVSFFSRNKKAKIENAVLTASLRIKSFVNWYRKSTILLDEWSSSL